MSTGFHNPEWDEYNPQGWDTQVAHLWDDATNGAGWEHDDYGKMLFDTAYIDEYASTSAKQVARDMLREYFEDQYGIDWDDAFDWEAFRDWYESA